MPSFVTWSLYYRSPRFFAMIENFSGFLLARKSIVASVCLPTMFSGWHGDSSTSEASPFGMPSGKSPQTPAPSRRIALRLSGAKLRKTSERPKDSESFFNITPKDCKRLHYNWQVSTVAIFRRKNLSLIKMDSEETP